MINKFSLKRRLLAPEVVQSSAMDCGPAALKCLLEGFGISVSYGRLREACQTDIDGTSIDTLEEVAVQLGLDAEQIMVPIDHVLLPEAQTLPALIVVRQPNGVTHFVVVWRRLGKFVQVMDPGSGRRWLSERAFLDQLYIHTLPVPAEAWRDWAGSDEFTNTLRRRLANLGLPGTEIDTLLKTALSEPGWRPLATLDAATRMVAAIVRAKGLAKGGQAGQALATFLKQAQNDTWNERERIPAAYWSVRPPDPDADGASPGEGEQLLLRGAVLVRVQDRLPLQVNQITAESLILNEGEGGSESKAPALSPELTAALEEPPSRPERDLLRFLRADGLLTPLTLLSALLLAAGSVMVEALLFRSLLDLGGMLESTQRLGAMGLILLFVVVLLFLHLHIIAATLRLGRRLETRLRMAFLAKIPRLPDRYFQSRLISDMAQRSHSIHQLRQLPPLGVRLLQLIFTLLLTTFGIIWLDPASALLASLTLLVVVGLPLITQPPLIEGDLQVRTHLGALSRFYLDALLGLVAIRTHGAERVVRGEHKRGNLGRTLSSQFICEIFLKREGLE